MYHGKTVLTYLLTKYAIDIDIAIVTIEEINCALWIFSGYMSFLYTE